MINVSVIVTTYNAEKTILDTLKSVMAQTFSGFEIILVDDGSTDQTVAMVKELSNQVAFGKIKVFPLPHMGRSKALNYGMSKASHEWIAILDADDLWHARKLELQVKYIDKFKLDFLATECQIFSHNHEINLESTCHTTSIEKSNLAHLSMNKMLYANFVAHSSVMVRKNLIQYDTERQSQIDYEMWLRLLNQDVKIYLLKECLLFHRIHANQSFEAKRRMRYGLSATGLQLKYCFMKLKFIPAVFVTIKLAYYLFLPRHVRFRIRNLLMRTVFTH